MLRASFGLLGNRDLFVLVFAVVIMDHVDVFGWTKNGRGWWWCTRS